MILGNKVSQCVRKLYSQKGVLTNSIATHLGRKCFLLTSQAFYVCDPSSVNGRADSLSRSEPTFIFSGYVGNNIFEPRWGAVNCKVFSRMIWPGLFLGKL